MARSQSIAVEACRDGRDAAHGGAMLSVWLRLAACMALSVAALGARTPETLAYLTALNLAAIAALKVAPNLVVKGARVFVVQAAIITALYVVRYGTDGAVSGLSISWQLYLAFLPGAVFMHATPVHRITAALTKVLPYRTAFVLSVSAASIPRIVHEIAGIYHTQSLRGARIMPRDIIRPSAWPDLVHCLVVPSIVKVMAIAGETALSARDRSFGSGETRTCWPGE